MRRLILGLSALLLLAPLLWIGLQAFRPNAEVWLDPLGWPSRWTWENFAQALSLAQVARSLLNSLWVTLLATTLTLVLGSSLAFALARFRLPGQPWIQMALAAGLVFPVQLVALPVFFQLKALGLLGSHWGLILVYTASGIPYAVLLLSDFLAQLPQELYEAALLDGCTPRQALIKIFLPLIGPGLTSLGLFTALSLYNEYFLAMVLLSGQEAQSLATLPLGLARLTIVSQYHADFGQLYAGLVVMMLPSLGLYLLLRSRLTQGVTGSPLKGA